ncbi:MAG: F0F1 ATP synthase subunit B [Bacillota bacterium]
MNINPLDILEHVLNLILIFLILRFLVYKPVRKFMLDREERLAAQREQAKGEMEQASSLKAEYEQSVKEAKVRAEGILKEGADRADDVAKQIIADAEQKAKLVVASAQQEARRTREDALSSLRDEVAAISVEVAQKILEREVSADDNRKIIEEYFSKVG